MHTGVAQILARMTPVAALANMRRINTPINRDGKAPKPRQLHHTSWGVICPVETPEGASCGLVRNLAIMAHVRVGCGSYTIISMLMDMRSPVITPVHAMDVASTHDTSPILVNGVLIGTVSAGEAATFCDRVRGMRRAQTIPFDCSVSQLDGWIHVSSDPGCLLRPVIVSNRLRDFLTITKRATQDVCTYNRVWDTLVSAGVIEYVDKHEEGMLTIALSPSEIDTKLHTHCEVHPSLIMGLCALLIPCEGHRLVPPPCGKVVVHRPFRVVLHASRRVLPHSYRHPPPSLSSSSQQPQSSPPKHVSISNGKTGRRRHDDHIRASHGHGCQHPAQSTEASRQDELRGRSVPARDAVRVQRRRGDMLLHGHESGASRRLAHHHHVPRTTSSQLSPGVVHGRKTASS